MQTTIEQRRLCREAASVDGSNIRVEVVPGNLPPALVGEGYHWETRGGTYVRHPSAYAKIGWSNLVYCASTRRVEVGEQWLLRQAIRQVSRSLPKVTRNRQRQPWRMTA